MKVKGRKRDRGFTCVSCLLSRVTDVKESKKENFGTVDLAKMAALILEYKSGFHRHDVKLSVYAVTSAYVVPLYQVPMVCLEGGRRSRVPL